MTISRRLFAVLGALAVLALGACSSSTDTSGGETSGGTPAGPGADASTTIVTVQAVESGQLEALVGKRIEADPLPDRGPEPSGTLDYAWHTAFDPKWLDPSLNTSSVSQFTTQYALHDALVKGIPGRTFAPSLAESYLIADDFMSAEFTLREGLTFHDGSPLTTEDVKFTYENYSGTGSDVLHDKLASIDVVDDLNITFNFKEPFLDFLLLYGTTATGAGWIVPSDYYQEVGADGFLAAPIGAGPFKFVENQNNTKIVYEANTDYWKKNPGVATLNWGTITDAATRFAALQTGEIDLANVLPGDLLDAAKADPNIEVVPTTAAPFWLEFVDYDDPANPFNDIRVREAAELVLDREAINQAETGGAGDTTGTWIPKDLIGALPGETITQDVARAKELMAEAGYADGFDAGQLTPLAPYYPLAERVITMLGEIGIRAELNQMERGAFLADIGAGKEGTLTGIILNVSGAGGDAAVRVRNFATCEGTASRICDTEIDAQFAEYEASTDPAERTELLNGIQQYIIDEHIFPYVYDLGLNMAQGPDVVQPGNKVWAQIPQYVYPGLWEDITVKQ